MSPTRPPRPTRASAVQVQALSYRHYRLPAQPPMSPFERFMQAAAPVGQRWHSRVLGWLGSRAR